MREREPNCGATTEVEPFSLGSGSVPSTGGSGVWSDVRLLGNWVGGWVGGWAPPLELQPFLVWGESLEGCHLHM
jgi:hypothetical protein